MRQFGLTLLVLGIVGFLGSSDQAGKAGPAPQGASLSETLRHPAGRWEAARFASGVAAGIGFLLAMFPKGR